MTAARPATAAPSRQSGTARRSARARQNAGRSRRSQRSALRIRWERVGRVALLVVLAVVLGLYVQQALAYFAAKSQADQQHSVVEHLMNANAQLLRQQKALNNPAVIQRDARELGMVRQSERPYVIMGLPSH